MPDSRIIRTDDLRIENRHRLLKTLRNHGPCSPVVLSQLTGLSTASISTLGSQMVDQGILVSKKHPAHQRSMLRGRPQSQLLLNPKAGHTVTLTLTIDLLRVQRVNYAGVVCATWEQILDTKGMSSDELLWTIHRAIARVCPANLRDSLQHIGVAFQGVTEHATGNLIWSPIIEERDVPLGSSLKKKFGVSVSVNNDTHLIAQALNQQYADVLGDTFSTILFSHGVGLGLYLNGQPFAGSRSSALEFGHLCFANNGALCRCGKRGCIDAYAADYGIKRIAQGASIHNVSAGRVADADFQRLVAKAEAGDRAVLRAFTIAGEAIGEGLATLFTLLDPMQVAMIGRTSSAFDLMRDGIESGFYRRWYRDISISGLLHCIDDEKPLLEYGLVQNSLRKVDQQLASFSSALKRSENGTDDFFLRLTC